METEIQKSAPYLSFRELLQDELLRRCSKNRGYSLRSFARALVIDPSSLARLLKGQRPISSTMKRRLGERLGLTTVELEKFTDSPKTPKTPKFDTLSLDAFTVICEWYHFAILEIIHLSDFKSDARWVAKRLGITPSEVNTAVERLVRLGLLEKKQGHWIGTAKNRTILNGVHTSVAERRLQKYILEFALRALEEVPVEVRSQTSMTMAINTRRIPEALERIKQFRRELSAILEQDTERDEVYHLSVSLYPVTQCKSQIRKERSV